MKTRLILSSIENDIDKLQLTKTQKKRAKLLCSGMLNYLIKFNHSLFYYTELSKSKMIGFTDQTDNKIYYTVRNAMLEAGIIECDGRYIHNMVGKKNECYGFKFNAAYFQTDLFSFNDIDLTKEVSKPIDIFKVIETLNKIEIVDKDKMMAELLNEAQNPEHYLIKLNVNGKYYIQYDNREEEIESDYVKVSGIKGKEYAHIDYLHKIAQNEDKKLIYRKGKVYIDTVESFKYQKQVDIMFATSYALASIHNKDFKVSRNKTNNRLDTTVTNLKSLVIDYMRLDGERLEELDISNSQFAYACYVNPDVDVHFKELAQTGKLYAFVAQEYGINEKAAKSLMFRIAFDKPRKKYDKMRQLFPKFMEWNDTFKKNNPYEEFANMLSKAEAEVMIDGALSTVLEAGFDALSIHDSLRIKESEFNKVQSIVQEYFDSIGFVCHFKNKTLKEESNDTVIEFTEDVLESLKDTFINDTVTITQEEADYVDAVIESVSLINEFDTNELVRVTVEKYPQFKGKEDQIESMICDMKNSGRWSIQDFKKVIKSHKDRKYITLPMVKADATIETLTR